MDEKNDSDKNGDDFMLPGFRFHPTDEELVEFYLKRKLQHRPLPIELIRQLDLYKYDPWDLPKLASTGEKEWYFYCPRDRKYKNSTRPNRVTGSGFWKATGTDRPIYSSDGGKCIGLKKSLVFYRGRAAKGIKTDWMMHEFRLPSSADGGGGGGGPPPHKRISDKTLPLTDSWAICRIFKKTNSTANRAISHNWNPSLSAATSSEAFNYTHFVASDNDFNIPKPSSTKAVSTLTSANDDYYFFPGNLVFSESSNASNKTTLDPTSPVFLNQSPALHAQQVMQESMNEGDDQEGMRKNASMNHMWENIRFPFNLPPGNLPWESPPSYPSEISSTTTYSTNKSYI